MKKVPVSMVFKAIALFWLAIGSGSWYFYKRYQKNNKSNKNLEPK